MRVVTDYQIAKELAKAGEPCFYADAKPGLFEKFNYAGHCQYVIGRKYAGLFDENDGSYVTVTTGKNGNTLIDREAYGAIPLFYSTIRPIISTDLRLIVEVEKPCFDLQALSEYLSTAYLTGGKTIYNNVRSLMPNQYLTNNGPHVKINTKNIFPAPAPWNEQEISALLEKALDNSVNDLLKRFPEKIFLNLSGGTDSTLLLAKFRQKDPLKEITTTTYFHTDWRADLNDWEYAREASEKFGSTHHLVNITNESFCSGHRNLMQKAKSPFHTYAAAFYVQNQMVADIGDKAPIVNGSGPDESIIGTEKIPVGDLLALKTQPHDGWLSYLTEKIDYIKMSEEAVARLVRGSCPGFVQTRKDVAATLLDAPDFVEFQRRYHAVTVLQDHIHELSSVAQVLDRPIIFPYLTNDFFRLIFSSTFETLNAQGTYKSAVKRILEKIMPTEFVHRKKIGFQSPSRPYFKSNIGLGLELSRLLSKGHSKSLNLMLLKSEIGNRLSAEVDLYQRYDFLEWTSYNILLLEELGGRHA